MAGKISKNDFIELHYTGMLQNGDIVFDTTDEAVAKEHHLETGNAKITSMKVCVGQRQVLPGLDEALEGKEVGKEYEASFGAEKAFGKRDVKKIKIVPSSTFKEHKMRPEPGLRINMDGELGTVTRVAGGRVIVNFNHPLAGKDVKYTFTIKRMIDDDAEKIQSFLSGMLRMPEEQVKVSVKDSNATVELPMAVPEQFTKILSEQLMELTGLKGIEFTSKAVEKKEKA